MAHKRGFRLAGPFGTKAKEVRGPFNTKSKAHGKVKVMGPFAGGGKLRGPFIGKAPRRLRA